MKRVRGGGGEAHENCMGSTLALVQPGLTYCTYINTEYNPTLHVHHYPHTTGVKVSYSTELKPKCEDVGP